MTKFFFLFILLFAGPMKLASQIIDYEKIETYYFDKICEETGSDSFKGLASNFPSIGMMAIIKNLEAVPPDSLNWLSLFEKGKVFYGGYVGNQLLIKMLSDCEAFYEGYLSARYKLNSSKKLDKSIAQEDDDDNDLVKTLILLEKHGVLRQVKKDKYRTAEASLYFHLNKIKECHYFYRNEKIASSFLNRDIFFYFGNKYPEVLKRYLSEYSYMALSPYDGGVQQVDTLFRYIYDAARNPKMKKIGAKEEIISENLIAALPDEDIEAKGPFYFQGVYLSPRDIRSRLVGDFKFRINDQFSDLVAEEITWNLSLGYGPALTKDQLRFLQEFSGKICAIRGREDQVDIYIDRMSTQILNVFLVRGNWGESLFGERNIFLFEDFKYAVIKYAKYRCSK